MGGATLMYDGKNILGVPLKLSFYRTPLQSLLLFIQKEIEKN